MSNCKKCGNEFEKNSNGQMYCKKCTPPKGHQRKALLEKDCVICKTHFITHKPNKVVCSREYCRVKLRRQNAAKSYIKLKTERKIEGDSTCPKCGKKFQGSSKWQFCHLHSWIREKSDYGQEFNLGY